MWSFGRSSIVVICIFTNIYIHIVCGNCFFIGFLGFFIKELVQANLRVAFDILTPPWHMQPGVIALPLSARTEMEITLVANLISLTPGTLSLDVSDDRKVLYIHAMFLDDEEELRRNLKEMEHRALELFR